MKFKVARANFHALLKDLSKIERSAWMTDNGHVVKSVLSLSVAEGRLHMSISGNGCAVQHSVYADEPEDGGPVYLDAKQLVGIVKNKSLGERLSFKLTATGLAVEGASRFVLKSMDENTAGHMPFPEVHGSLPQMKAGDLQSLIVNVKDFMLTKTDDPRFHIKGVYLHTNGDKLISVATNGSALGRYAVSRPDFLDIPHGLTIPASSINHMLAFLETVGSMFPVSIYIDETKFILVSPDGCFVTALVEAGYVNYEKVLGDGDSGISVDNQQFAYAIELCLPQSSGYVGIRSVAGEDGLEAFSQSVDKGSASSFFDADADGSTVGPLAFNPKYMLPALTREVSIDFGDGVKPIRIRGQLDREFHASIVPMRVSFVE
jgi:DNA polymerase III sliding clamp (beta) subunit (PCNA family)